MFARLGLVFRLFKKSFIFVSILYIIALVLFVSITQLKNSYELSLQNEFATKQAHIKISFVNDNIVLSPQEIKKYKTNIYNLSVMVDKVSEFVCAKKFYNSIGIKDGGNSNYQGDIKIIGLSTSNLVYDFFESKFTSREPFTIAYTPLEFLYTFKTDENSVVFNSALFNSYFPTIAAMQKFYFEHDDTKLKTKMLACFNDYDKQATIYTNITLANKLLNNKVNKIDGFFVNADNLQDIKKLAQVLKQKLPSDVFIVKSWLEDRQKQFMMFHIFEILSFIIIAIILVLSSLFILLLLYNAIVKKSYHLSVLFTIGFKLKNEIFYFLILVMILSSVASLGIIYILVPELTSLLKLPLSKNMLLESSFYVLIINLFFLIVSFILIDSAYKLKAKSVY